MNSVATASGAAATFLGANFMLLPRWLFGAGDTGSSAAIFIAAVPVALALWLSVRFPPHVLGPDDTGRAVHGSVAYAVATGWVYGVRTVLAVPTVAADAGRPGRAPHGVRDQHAAGAGHRAAHRHSRTWRVSAPPWCSSRRRAFGSFLADLLTPSAVRRWGRYATANGALRACRGHPARRGAACNCRS